MIACYFVCRLENTEIMAKSDVAATRLRYEQQVKNLHEELNSIQVCSSFTTFYKASKAMLTNSTSVETMRTIQTRSRLIQVATRSRAEEYQRAEEQQWPSEPCIAEQRR